MGGRRQKKRVLMLEFGILCHLIPKRFRRVKPLPPRWPFPTPCPCSSCRRSDGQMEKVQKWGHVPSDHPREAAAPPLGKAAQVISTFFPPPPVCGPHIAQAPLFPTATCFPATGHTHTHTLCKMPIRGHSGQPGETRQSHPIARVLVSDPAL